MTLEELRAQVKKNFERMEAINAIAKTEKRSLSDDEAAEFDKLDKEIDSLEAQIKREEKIDAKKRELAQEVNKPILPSGGERGFAGSDNKKEHERAYEDAFVNFLRGKTTNDDFTLLNQRAQSIGVDAKGGYLVPESWESTILALLTDISTIRKDITVRRTTSTTNIPVDTDEIELGWVDELADYPLVDNEFGKKQLGAHKLGGIVLLSREVIADAAADIQDYVTNKLSRGIAVAEAKAFVSGDGSGKPRGITLDAQTGVTTAAAGTITRGDIVDMVFSVPAEFRAWAKWRVSDAFAKAVVNLVDSNGRPLWYDGDMRNGAPASLMGYPVEITNDVDNDLSAGKTPALFGNFKNYVAADRGRIYIQVLRERYADKGAIGVLIDKRVDGRLVSDKAIKKFTMGS